MGRFIKLKYKTCLVASICLSSCTTVATETGKTGAPVLALLSSYGVADQDRVGLGAQLEGRLDVVDRCIVLITPAGSRTLAFPSQTALVEDQGWTIENAARGFSLPIGAEVSLAGAPAVLDELEFSAAAASNCPRAAFAVSGGNVKE